MNPELRQIEQSLSTCTKPEDVFGQGSFKDAQDKYHQLLKITHPDKNIGDESLASSVTKVINNWWRQAVAKFKLGIYGKDEPPVVITSKTKSYTLSKLWRVGDIADIYRSGEFTIKVCRDPANNDLLKHEADVLRTINDVIQDKEKMLAKAMVDLIKDGKEKNVDQNNWRAYFPELIETFNVKSSTGTAAVNVLKINDGMYSLQEVKKAKGILDIRDWAWMYRRILNALGFLGNVIGDVHGSISLDNILIHPEGHGVTLIDFCHSVPENTVLKSIPKSAEFYYNRVKFSKLVGPWLDIYMASLVSKQMLKSPVGPWPKNVPIRVQRFFDSWEKLQPEQVDDAWRLLDEFNELIDDHWPRRFRPFSMPNVV